jgi:hypothetical protein
VMKEIGIRKVKGLQLSFWSRICWCSISQLEGCTSCALAGLAQWSTGKVYLVPVFSSTLHVHACHPRGVLPVYWACRMFSRPGK